MCAIAPLLEQSDFCVRHEAPVAPQKWNVGVGTQVACDNVDR